MTTKAWVDGKFVDWQDATVHVTTHGLNYGSGVFEGLRAYATHDGNTAIFRLADHTKRLLESAKIIGMQVPYSYERLFEAQLQAVKVNELKEAYIRPLLVFADGNLGIAVNGEVRVFILVVKMGRYLGESALENGIKLGVSSYRRHSPNISMCRAKATGNYLNSMLAKHEAIANGFDEALMLDEDGYCSEGSGENIFAVKEGRLLVPRLFNALDGITRRSIIELADELGIWMEECRLTRDDIYTVDELFLTGTAAEVTPVCSVDGRVIGHGKRGEVTKKLQDAFFAAVKGKDGKHKDWLDYVYPEMPATNKVASG